MKLWQIWGVTLIVAAAYLVLASEMDYRAARSERCAVMHCI
jgi:hypothetical protein